MYCILFYSTQVRRQSRARVEMAVAVVMVAGVVVVMLVLPLVPRQLELLFQGKSKALRFNMFVYLPRSRLSVEIRVFWLHFLTLIKTSPIFAPSLDAKLSRVLGHLRKRDKSRNSGVLLTNGAVPLSSGESRVNNFLERMILPQHTK
ncbi:hypothetical protein E2C01_100515 [Portunus trituberculatus]|uniref:Uncharacterized protein n=1 Tax=Portunus trituberculatus TaxID=210409 RepID=A0A5B7KD93_PORTR|nr:hypothetical protein [Portunus trituberculatus]